MCETWLRPNRRAIAFGCAPPLLLVGLGAWLALGDGAHSGAWLRGVGAILSLLGLGTVALLLRQLWRPRIAYEKGQVLFYLRSGAPVAVPAHVVEAFFVGQGPATLPGGFPQHQTANLVARLAQRETEWAQRDVKPALGRWCEGYITIRGTWCEPLNPEVVRRINRRLKEVKATTEA